nr:hypothetical protein HUO10_005453 [Paraburkholderia busanensis]
MIFRRCLSFIFFQLLHSSRVRMQPIQKPVLLSNLQMSMQGDAILMAMIESLKSIQRLSHAPCPRAN